MLRMMKRLSLVALVALLAWRCRGTDRIPPGAPIILISIDTLRSDHLPAYGYSKIETPALDGLRADSVLYEHAYSHCPLTLVSHASVFTGLLPAEHGIRDNIGYELNKKATTIAELMKAKGFATGGAVSAIVLRGETGIKRGFDFWDDDIDIDPNYLSMGRAQRKGDETREIAQRWISQHKSKPFFFFFHIYEPHTPYDPPEPFRSKYGATYDGDVAAADAVIGRFLSFLHDEGIYDRATIILFSDHGEGLGDHGEDEHGILLYREALQVPLMLKLPKSGRHGRSVSTPVQLVDIFATLAGTQKSDGKSLLGDLATDRPIYAETYYPRFHFGWSDLHSLISGPHHYIQSPKPELYNMAADPRESKNVLQQNRRTYAALREAIVPYVKGAEAPKAIDPEQAKQLAALGYVGSTVSTTGNAELPDPKDRISSVGEIKQGFRAFQERRYEDATGMFSVLLRENPNMVDIWMMQSASLAKLGRREEAIDAAKKALRASPTATQLALAIAKWSLDLNHPDEAEKHARLALADLPNEAHGLLAEIWIARKDFTRARQEAELSRGSRADRPASLVLLGQIEKEQGHLDAALRYFDQAMALLQAKQRQPIEGLNFYRGDTLARLGRADEAEAAFKKEIAAYPTDPQAYKNLILLYVTEGKNDAATQLIFSLEKAAPLPPSYVAISETLKLIGDRNGARFWAARGLSRFPRDRQLQALLRG
jgi:arylsulfatase A-like enzyme/Tfp pilus assembly protein PilF